MHRPPASSTVSADMPHVPVLTMLITRTLCRLRAIIYQHPVYPIALYNIFVHVIKLAAS